MGNIFEKFRDLRMNIKMLFLLYLCMYIEGEGGFPYNTTSGDKKKKYQKLTKLETKHYSTIPTFLQLLPMHVMRWENTGLGIFRCPQESALLHVVVTTTKRERSDFKIKVL